MIKNFNNKTEKVGDEIKKDLKSGSKVNVAATIFSVYGYESLKAEFNKKVEFNKILLGKQKNLGSIL